MQAFFISFKTLEEASNVHQVQEGKLRSECSYHVVHLISLGEDQNLNRINRQNTAIRGSKECIDEKQQQRRIQDNFLA